VGGWRFLRAVPCVVILIRRTASAREIGACQTTRRTDPSTRRFTGRSRSAAWTRRLFFLSLLLGARAFNLFYSFLAGLLMFVGLYGCALWATRRDPEMLRIVLASSKTRRRYDPGKHDRIDMEVVSC